MSKNKNIKAFMRKNSGYALFDSDENVLIGVIQCSTDDEFEAVNLTEKVQTMIAEHFVADEVEIHSVPDVVLHPDMGTKQSFGASMEEDGDKTDRSFEIISVAIY